MSGIYLGPFDTVNQLINAAITMLRAEHYIVTQGSPVWESPAALRQRLGLRSSGWFADLLKHPDCPDFRALRGETGRIIKMESNPALEVWLIARRDKSGQP